MIVLDADVLIGALDASDAHHAEARRLLSNQTVPRIVSVVTLTEVLVAPAADNATLRTARRALAALGVEVHAPTEPIGVDAARLRGRHPISVPDAYCLATARRIGAAVAAFDARLIRAAGAESIQVVAMRSA